MKISKVILFLLLTSLLCGLASAGTVYVSNLGTDEYTTDGTDDHVEINNALIYASEHPGTTVYLRGQNTYWINSTLTVPNNTVFTGDLTAEVKLINNAGWARYIGLVEPLNRIGDNITICNFTIDGNLDNQTGYSNGMDYYTVLRMDNTTNFTVHDMTLRYSRNDGIRDINYKNSFKLTEGVGNILIYNNNITTCAHDGIYIVGWENATIFNNTILPNVNSAIRVSDCNPVRIFNNSINVPTYTGGAGIYTSVSTFGNLSDMEIYNNYVNHTNLAGITVAAVDNYALKNASNIRIHHNIVKDCGRHQGASYNFGGGISIQGFNNTTIENNVIDGCYRNGIFMSDWFTTDRGTATASYKFNTVIRNNIITNTREHPSFVGSGYGIETWDSNNYTASILYNDVWNNTAGSYDNVTAGANDISSDPLFVDSAAGNYYLKSTEGYWNGTAWLTALVNSPCIDAGDPSSDYSNEPEPNGDRINLGAYGNTAYASKSISISTPTITWNNPANITYGTALSGIQNNATASVSGIFVYNPANGTILAAGVRILNVTFIPTDSTNYTNATASVTLNITKATPAITWNNTTNITYGTALSSTQLNANASIPGSFVYNKTVGTVLNVGTHVLGTTFTPTDSTNYTNATASTILNVSKAIPTITWNNPANITYGIALNSTQLNANASIAGTFVYSPANGTVLAAGVRTLNVTFIPTDSTNYTNATKSVTLNVSKDMPYLSWNNPTNITYGTALSGTQLNATSVAPGTFTYNPPSGTILGAGQHILEASFTPNDPTNISASQTSVILNVTKATPTITWNNPENITNGTALSSVQLNAEASVAGAFVYSPVSGTVLSVGNNQRLNVTFTPTDSANYTNTTASAYINVVSKTIPTITWNNPANITYPTALSGTQNNASASVTGTFVYSPVNGTILAAGVRTLNVTFTPTDTTNYTTATGSATLNVTKATPVITWASPTNITYGTALSGTQNNASANVAGAFVYNKTNGTILPAGVNVLGVTFTPTDSTNYTNVTASATLNVTKATSTITWTNPANITYGTALSGTQLNANGSVAGSMSYSPASGVVLSYGNQTLNVAFTPTDSANYSNSTTSVYINVTKATPTITWSNPNNITYGTALNGTQNNATANVAGNFTYSLANGTVLAVGTHILNATFVPTDTTNYTNATANVTISVIPQAPVAAFSANVTSGIKPLVVAFTDSSTNSPTAWSWDLNGDGSPDSTSQNPACVYSTAGIYNVSLTATNAGGNDIETKLGYITVNNPTVTIDETINLTNASVRVNNLTFNEFRVENQVIATNDTLACRQGSVWANLTILPNHQINVTVNTWNVAGDYSKIWNESSSTANTTTNHRITGYPENTYIDIYRDGVGYTTVKSDTNGMINWTYNGGYSEHMFETRISDTQITISSPSTVTLNSSTLSSEYELSEMSELYDSVTGTVSSGYTLAGLMVLTLGAAGILRYLGFM